MFVQMRIHTTDPNPIPFNKHFFNLPFSQHHRPIKIWHRQDAVIPNANSEQHVPLPNATLKAKLPNPPADKIALGASPPIPKTNSNLFN